jgi:hypothetical protein
MIIILLGIVTIFLFMCFSWVLLYKDYGLSEPPLIIKIIGWTQVVIFVVAVLLSVSYCIGSFMSEIIKELIK